ncbi:DUF2510 domain-containing protein [Nocardioides panacisoli]|uniref:DUF2510 domain-containing protein n=1 Tax=Nocardioides panacisoli TaxID=627624 RepID=UPI001C62AB8C|nr:DUF2510 domain-containing protein [Nocardioides panacisoli]QYJ03121.1 DUF2510 domain-containing protein [Nocardioides panacisoli]
MAQAGWYPDPAGTPATYRYWDGSQWSSVTTSDPASPPPDGGVLPPPPSSGPAYGDVPADDGAPASHPGGYTGAMPAMAPTQAGPSRGRRGKVLLVGGLVVALLAVLGVVAVLGVRTLGTVGGTKVSDDVPATGPDQGAGDQLVPPPDDSDSPPPGTLQPGPAECREGAPTVFGDQSGNGRIGSHGLSIPRVTDYQVDPLQSFAFTWAFDFIPQVQQVEEGWASVYGVGGVETTFGSPEETAEAVVECMTKSPLLYSGFTDRKDLVSKKVKVPGAESAWRITTEIRVDNPGITVDGDVVDVVVVDTGSKAVYGLYTSVVPIDDQERLDQQKEVTGDLSAE